MGKFLISILLLIILVPILIVGGSLFNVALYLIALLGMGEFINIKKTRKKIPIFIETISFIAFTFLIFANARGSSLIFSIDYRILAGIFALFLIPTVLYHDRSLYSVNDAFYLIGGVLFLGISFSLLILVRNIGLDITIYLFLISTFTDTYALITGKLIGKHKLLKEISPGKTVEGMIGGALFGTLVPIVFYKTVINSGISIFLISLVTLFLCLLGQFGDLCFSAIKRYFGKKDFSNVIPFHGGVLDRFDSIIFILLGFMFFINIIGG